MLQVSGRESRIKHKALLMGTAPPTDSMSRSELGCEPQQLPGDPFERMCSDPEILRARKRFFMAAGSVLGLAMLATFLQMTGMWSILGSKMAGEDGQLPASSPDDTALSHEQSAPLKPSAPKPIAVVESIKKLSFRAASQRNQAMTANSEPQLALEKFLAAPTIEEKLAFVVNPKAVEQQMRDFYANHPVGVVDYQRIESAVKTGASFIEFRVVLKDGTKKFAAVVPSPDGPRVDWPSFVALGDLEWEQMRQDRPQKPTLMRVLAATATHFTGYFSDAKNLRCVQLVPAGNPTAPPVYGYVPSGTDLDRDLDYWLRSSGGKLAPLTVKLCYSPMAKENDQVWITELVVPGWVTIASSSSK